MANPIKLYCDKVAEGNVHGESINGDKILYNLNAISKEWFDKYTDMLSAHDNATIFLPAGRFLVVVTCSWDEGHFSYMAIMDLQNNDDFAKYWATQSEGNDEVFMYTYKMINYEADYNKFALVEGTPTKAADT